MICSAYLPYDSTTYTPIPPIQEIVQLVNYYKRRKLALLVGCDTNAHHTVWDSANINSRGHALFDYLLTSDLVALNKVTH